MKCSSKLENLSIFLVLLLIMPYATIAVLILTPALLQLSSHYNITASATSNIVVFAMLGYAIGPIIYGPLIRCYGKKTALYIGIIISLMGIMSCVLSFYQHNFILMLIGRFITSLGAVSGMVITYAIVAECYSEVAARKILSILSMLAFAVIPSFTICLGGYITQNISWLYCLYFLLVYGIACMVSVYVLKNSLSGSSQVVINTDSLTLGYLALLKNKAYMGYVSLAGIAVAAVYIYAEKAPIVAVNQLQLTPGEFGYYNLIPYLGYIMALYLSSRLSAYVSYKNIIIFGMVMMGAGGVIILLPSLLGCLSASILFFGAFMIFIGSAPIVPNSMVLATKSIQNRSFAASFGSFFYMVLATILTWLVGLLRIIPSVSYSIAIMLLVILIFIINLRLLNVHKSQSIAILLRH